jgi:hypothetical protein
MLAYLASAEYDALIATWYKYQFNRPSAYNADGTITTHLPKNTLRVIIEGAVIAAVAKDLLLLCSRGKILSQPRLLNTSAVCNGLE